MADVFWTGNANPVRQVSRVVAANAEVGDKFILTCNNKTITVTAESTSLPAIYQAMKTALDTTEIPEFQEVTATLEGETDYETALILTGPSDGTPVTITASASNASIPIVITTTQAGNAGTNQQTTIALAGTPTGGTFTLSHEGHASGAIAYNASAGTVQTAIEGISSIGAGNVTVTGASPTWVATFQGTLAATPVTILVGNGASLTGAAAVSVTTVTDGAGGTSEVQSFAYLAPSTLTNKYYWAIGGALPNGLTPTVVYETIGWNNIWATLETFLNTAGYTSADFTITQYPTSGGVNQAMIVTFKGALANANLPQLSLVNPDNGSSTGTTTTQGSSTTIAEVQNIRLTNTPTGGTFTLSFNGYTTAGIAYNAAAATVQTALEGLTSIGAGNITVTGTSTTSFTATFAGTLVGINQPAITGSGASLTGSRVDCSITRAAIAKANEKQQVAIDGTASGGTFTLTFNSETTTSIAYNASAATVQTALEGLATPVPGDVTVTGSAGGPWLVEWKGAYANTNVAEMTATSSLTGSGTQTFTLTTTTTPTGPNWFDNANNWSGSAVPVDGDNVWFVSGPACKFGLSNSSIDPAAVYMPSTYNDTGAQIGLYDINPLGYREYRTKRLTLSSSSVGTSMPVVIGQGDDSGCKLIRLDTGTRLTDLQIYKTDDADRDQGFAVDWLGTNANNTVTVMRGDFASAMGVGEVATIKTLTMGYVSDVEGDALVQLGPGVTLTNVKKVGGDLQQYCGASGTWEQTAGTTEVLGSGSLTAPAVRGGDLYYSSTATLAGSPAATVSGTGKFSFEHNMATKSVTNAFKVYGDEADVYDPHKVVTSLAVNYVETTRQENIGRNYTVTRS